jgi:hypothetical protein
MSAKAGERAEKTADFYCASCREKVHVSNGDRTQSARTDTPSSTADARRAHNPTRRPTV